jgi:hypothetical protein
MVRNPEREAPSGKRRKQARIHIVIRDKKKKKLADDFDTIKKIIIKCKLLTKIEEEKRK